MEYFMKYSSLQISLKAFKKKKNRNTACTLNKHRNNSHVTP